MKELASVSPLASGSSHSTVAAFGWNHNQEKAPNSCLQSRR